MENITMGRSAATYSNVNWAVEKLGLNEFIRSLPKGYDTILDPLGKKLPRSIAQKILLARSIADKPKLLLLEDAFEHIEMDDRVKIIDFLTAKQNGWTLVAVSSDPYLAKHVDRIVVMKAGKIVADGKDDQLLQQFYHIPT